WPDRPASRTTAGSVTSAPRWSTTSTTPPTPAASTSSWRRSSSPRSPPTRWPRPATAATAHAVIAFDGPGTNEDGDARAYGRGVEALGLRGRERPQRSGGMRAIDFHVHLATREWMVDSLGPLREATVRHFRADVPVRSIDEMAEEFRADDLLGVLLAWDAEAGMGLPALPNDYVAACVEKHPDTFVG